MNTENAIIYTIDAGAGATNLLATFFVDNGIHIWVNGDFRYGARHPLGIWYYDIPLGELEAGVNHVQVLREDSGGATGYSMEIRGTPAPLPGTTCTLGPIDQEANTFELLIQNQRTGLLSISVTPANANVDIPAFESGSMDPVTVVIHKMDTTANAVAEFAIEDMELAQLPCDWANIVKQGNEVLSLETIQQNQHLVTVQNGVPGFKKLHLTVAGETLSLDRLSDDEQREADLSQQLGSGDNTIQIRGFGPPGTSATLLFPWLEVDSM